MLVILKKFVYQELIYEYGYSILKRNIFKFYFKNKKKDDFVVKELLSFYCNKKLSQIFI